MHQHGGFGIPIGLSAHIDAIDNHIDLVSITDALVPQFVRYGSADDKDLKQIWVLQEIDLYYAFNKDTDPAVVQRFRDALLALEGERQRLIKLVGLSPKH